MLAIGRRWLLHIRRGPDVVMVAPKRGLPIHDRMVVRVSVRMDMLSYIDIVDMNNADDMAFLNQARRSPRAVTERKRDAGSQNAEHIGDG